MDKHIRYMLVIFMVIAIGLLITAYGFAEAERIGKPEVVTAKKAKKQEMKTLLNDAKSAFNGQQQQVIVKIIKELGGTE